MAPPLSQDAAGQYLAYRSSAAGQSAGDALLKEMESGGKPSEGGTPQAPAAAVPQGGGFSVTGAVKDIAKGVAVEQPRAMYTGARNAIQNSYDMVDDFLKWSASKTGLPEGGAIAGPMRDWIDKKTVADPSTTTGKLSQGVYQFLTGLAGVNKLAGAAGLPAQMSGSAGYAYNALKGAITNFSVFDPHQQRLSNLIERFPVLSNPVTQYLESKPGDTEAEGRFKNALEGTGLGVLADGMFKAVRMLRGASDAKGIELPSADAATPATAEGPAFRQLGDPSPDAPLVSDKPFAPPAAGEAPAGAGRPPGTPLGQYLKEKYATAVTSAENPAEFTGAVKPEKPQTFINFARIDTPEDVQNTMQQLADRFGQKVQSSARGTQTFEQIKLNSAMENAWDLLQNRRIGQPLNAEQSVAARELWASSADKVKELAQAAVSAPTPENLFAFRKMMATHYAIQSEVIGARTETARALASWRIPVGTSASRLQDITERMTDMSGGPDTVREMAQYVLDRAQANQPAELEAFMGKSAWARTRDAMLQAFTDGLLTGPRTQTKILASNVSTAMWRVMERATAERMGGEVAPGESVAMFNGWIGSFKDAMTHFGKSFRTGVTGEGIGEPHDAYPSNISAQAFNISEDSVLGRAADFIGSALSVGRRAIVAQHDMALTMAYRGEMNAQAWRQAMGEVTSGELERGNISQRVAELLHDPPESMMEVARNSAKYQAFLDEPGNDTIGKMTNIMLDARQQIPALRVIAPFIKIPSRIMSYTFERTPFAPLMDGYRTSIAQGGATADLARAQMAMGTMATMAAADMTLSGQLKGGGREQKALEQAEERTGARRDSLKIGDRWYNINGVHPVGKLLLMAADVTQNLSDGQTELHDPTEAGKIAVATALAIGRTMVDNSYMQGFANLFAAMHDASVKGAGTGALLSTAGGAIPAASGAAASAMDPYQREIYSMLDEFKSKIPGLSMTLPPRRNLWGEPVPSGHDPLTRLLSPVGISDAKDSPIDKEILRLGANIEMPEAKQHFGQRGNETAIDLRKYPHDYSRLLELSGQEIKDPATGMNLKDSLDALVTGGHPLSTVYDLKTDSGKELMIRGLITRFQQQARDQILQEDPQLAREVSEKGEAQRALKTGVLQ